VADLPEELIFNVDYLGGQIPTSLTNGFLEAFHLKKPPLTFYDC